MIKEAMDNMEQLEQIEHEINEKPMSVRQQSISLAECSPISRVTSWRKRFRSFRRLPGWPRSFMMLC